MAEKKVLESWVKKKVVDHLKSLGVYYFFPVASGYMKSGVPDIVCCIKGKFVAIECKAGKGKTTALQDLELEKIRQAKGFAYVVHENNIQDLKELLIWMR